jgi:glycosyltransferase 2 family protein
MDLLPPSVNRLIAFGCLAGIAIYLAWIITGRNRRELGQNGWKVVLPSAPLTFVQILIGVVDLGFCALAMYLLMPTHPDIDFVSVAVVFILATLLGFASHAPGSLGVFDAAMLVALPQFGKEQLLATLLVFRILYFMIPFAIAITIMGTRELGNSDVIGDNGAKVGHGNGNSDGPPDEAASPRAAKSPVARD